MRSPATRLPLLLASALLASVLVGVALPAEAGAVIPGTISGRVTQEEGKFDSCEDPYSGDFTIMVDAFNVATGERVGPVMTNALGNYSIIGIPAGDYKVRFRRFDADGLQSYAWFTAETVTNKTTYEEGLPIAVPEVGTSIANACLQNQGGGTFKGTVTTNVAGVGPECVYVHFFEATSGIGTGVTALVRTTGVFRSMEGFPPGDYRALAIMSSAPGCDGTALDQWWKGDSGELGRNSDGTTVMANPYLLASSRVITIEAGVVRKKIHFQLVPIGTCDGRTPTILGTTADDIIVGTPLPDVIKTFSGKDKVNSLDGRDRVCTGGGDDFVNSGRGRDRIFGGNGDDVLNGDSGADSIRGGDGNDRIYGKSGDDRLRGNDGDDRIYGGGDTDRGWGGAGSDVCNANTEIKVSC